MEKVYTIWRKGVCLNVFKNNEGEDVLTFSKPFYSSKGGRKFSSFFNADRGDLKDLIFCLNEYKKQKDDEKIVISPKPSKRKSKKLKEGF